MVVVVDRFPESRLRHVINLLSSSHRANEGVRPRIHSRECYLGGGGGALWLCSMDALTRYFSNIYASRYRGRTNTR